MEKVVLKVPEKPERGAHSGQEMKQARKTAVWLDLLQLQAKDSEVFSTPAHSINLLDASMALLPNFGQDLLSLPAEAHVALPLKKQTFKLSLGLERWLSEVQLPAGTDVVIPSTSTATHHSL